MVEKVVETVTAHDDAGITQAARLLHDFNTEYDEPTPPVADLAIRLTELLEHDRVTVLLARDETAPVGVAVLRLSPSLWSRGQELYLAELYVVPDRRGQGFGRALIGKALDVGRERGADYAFLVTSEDDRAAQRLYRAAGFRSTEGEDGPAMVAFERDL